MANEEEEKDDMSSVKAQIFAKFGEIMKKDEAYIKVPGNNEQ